MWLWSQGRSPRLGVPWRRPCPYPQLSARHTQQQLPPKPPLGEALASGVILRVVVLVIIRVPSGDTPPGSFQLPTPHRMKEKRWRPAGMHACLRMQRARSRRRCPYHIWADLLPPRQSHTVTPWVNGSCHAVAAPTTPIDDKGDGDEMIGSTSRPGETISTT